jgi:ArsR family transcriptional regulator
VTSKLERHAEQLGALGHPARLGILRFVVQGGEAGTTTTELQAKLDIPWTTLNHHIDRLVAAGLLSALRTLTDFLWEDCCKLGKSGSKSCC